MPTQKNLVDEWLAMNERLKQAYPAAVWYLWFLFFGQDAFWDVAYTTVDLDNAETQSELRSHGGLSGRSDCSFVAFNIRFVWRPARATCQAAARSCARLIGPTKRAKR